MKIRLSRAGLMINWTKRVMKMGKVKNLEGMFGASMFTESFDDISKIVKLDWAIFPKPLL